MLAKPTEPSSLSTDALNQAARTLARAFEEDPLMQYVFPDKFGRERHIYALHRPLLNACMTHGGVETAAQEAAVAAWIDGKDVPLSLSKCLAAGMGRVPFVTPPLALRRLLKHDHAAELAVTSGMRSFSFAYLWVVGVSPDHRNLKLGRKVIEQTLEAMSDRYAFCALKTETFSNVAIYERLGFSVFSETRILSSTMQSWAMRRQLNC